MQIVMSCFSYGGEDTRRLIALAFCVDPKHPHTRTQHTHTKTTPPWGHKKRGPPHQGDPHSQKKLRQPSTLPHPPRCSTINTTGLSSPGSKRILGVSPKLSPPQNHQTTTHPTKKKRGPSLLFQNYTANANTTNNYSVNKSSAY